MTATQLTGAPLALRIEWDSIEWKSIQKKVLRLQVRIAKAFRENRYGKAKALQRILTHSFYAKLLAVKRVTENKGAKTPGVDGVIWNTNNKKIKAVHSLRRRGYKTKPLRRIYIPKSNGKLRPLSIPVMECRAQQALHLLALEPISEVMADKNSYGFRPKRSTADAIEQCFNTLAKKTSAKWVLEGDIKSCFDKINHKWLETNTPMDIKILKKWLEAGYIDKKVLYRTQEGTPQGGLISATLLVITLRGLEEAILKVVSRKDKVNVVIYADDFIVTGTSKEVLDQKVKPVIINFLKDRGLELSLEKTRITHINEGFDFLGQNVRKYDGTLLIKPAKKGVKAFLKKIREHTRKYRSAKTANLIWILNPIIWGWANHHRHVVSKRTFNYVDCCIFKALWQWACRRHPNKGKRWIKRKYFRNIGARHWAFASPQLTKRGKPYLLTLKEASKVQIVRHIKIRVNANPYDPLFKDYYLKRNLRKDRIHH